MAFTGRANTNEKGNARPEKGQARPLPTPCPLEETTTTTTTTTTTLPPCPLTTTTTEAPPALSPCEQRRREEELMRNNPYVMMADQPIAEATTMEEVGKTILIVFIAFCTQISSGLGAGAMIHNIAIGLRSIWMFWRPATTL